MTDAPQILRVRDVMARTGLAKSTIYQLLRTQQFPQPVRITDRAVGWLDSDVSAWIERRAKLSEE